MGAEINKYRVKEAHIVNLDRFIDKLTNEQKKIVTNGSDTDRSKD